MEENHAISLDSNYCIKIPSIKTLQMSVAIEWCPPLCLSMNQLGWKVEVTHTHTHKLSAVTLAAHVRRVLTRHTGYTHQKRIQTMKLVQQE